MNPLAIMALKIIRGLRPSDGFGRGYALGLVHGLRTSLEPWERQYLEVIAEHVIWEKGA